MHSSDPHFAIAPWSVIEESFLPENYRRAEGVLALANGYLGQRASFEEGISGVEALTGNYIAGVFDAYPNEGMIKLKGRPTHPREMVNIPNYLPVALFFNNTRVDLSQARILAYHRTLSLQHGILSREYTVSLGSGETLRIAFERLLSLQRRHIAAMQVRVTPLSSGGTIRFASSVDASVTNLKIPHFGNIQPIGGKGQDFHGVTVRTLHTGIDIAVLARETLSGGKPAEEECLTEKDDRVSTHRFTVSCEKEETVVFTKTVAVVSSRDCDLQGGFLPFCEALLKDAAAAGFATLKQEQQTAWQEIWNAVEIEITERAESQALTQGLRYSIFQMMQNAPRGDHTINIGAKGLSGEHYFGTYFWDTEAYMVPLFGFIAPSVARDLIRNRAYLLPGARNKAVDLDVKGAMYPFMSDADGNESSTLWQFGLMGIHVSAAVAWGVWFYYCVSGDLATVADEGIDVMVETSRFWVSRVFWSEELQQFVINRVLGPDEYHQSVDNNFYTNIMAQENLRKTLVLLERINEALPERYAKVLKRLGLSQTEIEQFKTVAEKIRLPYDATRAINLQDDRFLSLEPYDLAKNPPGGAINAVWSYDRVGRTQLLRQADVLVAHLLVGDRFDPAQLTRDFDYYEPKTTHDSSLSFCHHSILAAALKRKAQAYDYFLKTARLDIDDIHGNSWQGVHTACLAGAWQCVVMGFGGVRWYNGALRLDPLLPDEWDAFSFSIWWHGTRLSVRIEQGEVELKTNGKEISLLLGDKTVVAGATPAKFPYNTQG